MLLTLLIGLLVIASFWVPRDPNKTLFLGALIGAGASLIGGALNRRADKKANAANSPVGQVKQWEAAGINPAFGISSGAYIPQRSTSIGDSFAEAGSIFGEAVARDHAEKLKETETKKENAKLRQELDKIAKGSGPSEYQRYAGVLPLPSAGQVTAPSGAVSENGFPKVERPFEVEAGSGGVDMAGNPVTNLSFGGKLWEADANQSDAEMVETRYGDFAQELFGFGTLLSDVNKNIIRPAVDQYKRKEAKNLTSAQKREKESWDVKRRDARDKVTARRKAAGGGPLLIDPPNEYTSEQARRAANRALNKRILSLGK